MDVPPADLRLAYIVRGLALIPEDRFTDIKGWVSEGAAHRIEYTSLHDQKAILVNSGELEQHVQIGGREISCPAGGSVTVGLERRVDEERAEFFAEDFMDEPGR